MPQHPRGMQQEDLTKVPRRPGADPLRCGPLPGLRSWQLSDPILGSRGRHRGAVWDPQ